MSDATSEDTPLAVEHEYDAETPASIALIQAICACTDTDPIRAPTELGFTLHDQIDPGALDTILADGNGRGETVVSFQISGEVTYDIEISDDGRIAIEPDRLPED